MMFGVNPGPSGSMYRSPYFEPDHIPYGETISPKLIEEVAGGTGDLTHILNPLSGTFSGLTKWMFAGRTAIHSYFLGRNAMATAFSPNDMYYRYRAFRIGGPLFGDVFGPMFQWFNQGPNGEARGINSVWGHVFDFGPHYKFEHEGKLMTGFDLMKIRSDLSFRESMIIHSPRYHELKSAMGIEDGAGFGRKIGNRLRDLHGLQYGKHPFLSGTRWKERIFSTPGLRTLTRKTRIASEYMADQRSFAKSILGMEVGAGEFLRPDYDPILLSRSSSLSRASFYRRAQAATLSGMIDSGARFGNPTVPHVNLPFADDAFDDAVDAVRGRPGLSELSARLKAGDRGAIREAEGLLSAQQRTAYKRYVLGTTARNAAMNLIRLPAAVIAGTSFVLPLATGAIQKFGDMGQRLAETVRKASRPDFGGDDVIMSSRLASERQRQMAAIADSGLNARGLLGNEAAYYH